MLHPRLGITPFLEFCWDLPSSLFKNCKSGRQVLGSQLRTLILQPSLMHVKRPSTEMQVREGPSEAKARPQPLLIQDWRHRGQLFFPSKSFTEIICCSRAGTDEFSRTLNPSKAVLIPFASVSTPRTRHGSWHVVGTP